MLGHNPKYNYIREGEKYNPNINDLVVSSPTSTSTVFTKEYGV